LKHIVLDTDPGIDDALALLIALNSPNLRIEAITSVVGNVSHAQAHSNVKRLLEFVGVEDVPVCGGAERPLFREYAGAEAVHGSSGLGGARLPEPRLRSREETAVEMILETADSLGKALTLLAIGPLTNIAAALLVDPGLAEKVSELVIMGGAFGVTPYGWGNVTPVAEFNIWHDPEAAAIVFHSGIPITAIGLDTTTHPQYRLTKTMFEEIKQAGSRTSRLVVGMVENLVEKYDGMSLHDPQALAYVLDPSRFETVDVRVDVETQGFLTRGMTVVERRPNQLKNGQPIHVVTSLDEEWFLELVRESLTGG